MAVIGSCLPKGLGFVSLSDVPIKMCKLFQAVLRTNGIPAFVFMLLYVKDERRFRFTPTSKSHSGGEKEVHLFTAFHGGTHV